MALKLNEVEGTIQNYPTCILVQEQRVAAGYSQGERLLNLE